MGAFDDLRPHRCDVWRAPEDNEDDGTRSVPVWGRVATSVRCRFQTGESVKSAHAGIVGEDDNLFTLDLIHFEVTADLQNGDVLRQTTGPDAGDYWIVRGDLKKQNVLLPKLSVRASRAMDVHSTIKDAYA